MKVYNRVVPRTLQQASPGDLVTYLNGSERILGVVAVPPEAAMQSGEWPRRFLLELASQQVDGEPLLTEIEWPDTITAAIYSANDVHIVPMMPGGLVQTTAAPVDFKAGRLQIDSEGNAYIMCRAYFQGQKQRSLVNLADGRIGGPKSTAQKLAFDAWSVVYRSRFADDEIFTFPASRPEEPRR